MSERQQFRAALELMPQGTAITLSRETLIQLLAEEGGKRLAPTQLSNDARVDLSVRQVAELFGRSPNTVRHWLESGLLKGYKLFGREWRVTREMVQAFQEEQRQGPQSELRSARDKPIDAWRKVG